MPNQANSDSDVYLMSPPAPDWALRGRANFRSKDAEQVDPGIAFGEWLSLARAIEAAGSRVIAHPHDSAMTGLPYCAEAGHPIAAQAGPMFLLPRMWAPHRQAEWNHWLTLTEALGFETFRGASGYWEGQGDVAEFDGKTLLFVGGRTNSAGLSAVRHFFAEDALVVEIRQPAFHGNVAVLPVPGCDRLVVCPELLVSGYDQLVDAFGKDRIIEITEQEARRYSTNALPVGQHLIAPSIAPQRVLDALADAGMNIVSLPMRELCEKAGGASRCLVCLIPGHVAANLELGAGTDLDTIASQRGQV